MKGGVAQALKEFCYVARFKSLQNNSLIATDTDVRGANWFVKKTQNMHLQSAYSLPVMICNNSGYSQKGHLHKTAKISPIFAIRPILPGRPSDFCKHPTDRHTLHKIRWRNTKIPISKFVREPGKIRQTA